VGGKPRRGQHFGDSPLITSAEDLPDGSLVQRDGRSLVVRTRPKGVLRIVRFGSMTRADPLLWPLSWISHCVFYWGQWSVDVIEIPAGASPLFASDRIVYSGTYSSRKQATAARERLRSRIDTLSPDTP
jgi:hypothetical protein